MDKIFIIVIVAIIFLISVVFASWAITNIILKYYAKHNEIKKVIKVLEEKNNHLKESNAYLTENIELVKEQYRLELEKEREIQEKVQQGYIEYNSLLKDIENQQNLLKQIGIDTNTAAEQLQKVKDTQQVNLEFMEKAYIQRVEELNEAYNKKTEEVEGILEDLQQKTHQAILNSIREYEEKDKKNFYMLQISSQDLADIIILREIEKKLFKKEVLGKIIYKNYIEKYYTDLVGRVIGKDTITGIYKITNQQNQMCYIGQAVDIKKRWQQHIKRAVGAEPLTNNKLYPAMRDVGVENFSFEIIDECDKSKLSEREKFWQEYYSAKTFGYSVK